MTDADSNRKNPTRLWAGYRKWLFNFRFLAAVIVMFGGLLLYQGMHIYQEQNAINQLKTNGFIVKTHRTPGRLIVKLLGYEIRGKRPTTYSVRDNPRQSTPHLEQQLQLLAESLGTLSHPVGLHLEHKITVSSLTIFSNVEKLKNLELRDCPELKTLEGLQNSSQLQSLGLTNCRQLKNLDALTLLTELQFLFLQGCDELESVQGLATCINLRSIGIENCPNLKSLSVIKKLPLLETLQLSGKSDQAPVNQHLRRLDFIPETTKLRDLNLMDIPLIDDFAGLKKATNLTRLLVSGNKKIRSIDAFPLSKNLDTLQLNQISNLESLDGISKYPVLRTLIVAGCPKLSDVSDLHHHNVLQRLVLNGTSVSQADIKKLQTAFPRLSIEGIK